MAVTAEGWPGAERGPLYGVSDDLRGKYGKMAKDSAAAPARREAAGRFVVAEAHLTEDEAPAALQAAEEALAQFRAAGDEDAAIDAARLALSALLCQGQRREAERRAREELDRARAASAAAGPAGRVNVAKLLLAVAEAGAGSRRGRGADEALSFAQEAAEVFRSRSDRRMEASALLVVATRQVRRADDRLQGALESLATARQALGLFKEVADQRGEAAASHGMALACLRCSALGSAAGDEPGGWLALAESAVRLFQQLRLKRQEVFERICIAQWLTAESPRRGLSAAEQTLAYCREIGSSLEAAALSAVVHAHLSIQDISKAWKQKEAGVAIRKAKEGLLRLRSIGDVGGQAQVLSAMVSAHIARDDVSQAVCCAEEAIERFRELGAQESECALLQLVTGLYLKLGAVEKALRAAKQINALSTGLAERAVALETIHEVNLERGDMRKARAAADELLALCEDEGDKKREAIVRLMLSNVHFAEADYGEAVALAREAQAILNDLGATREEAQALRVVAEVHFAGKEPDAAARAADKAKRLLRSVGDQEQEATVQLLLAQIRLQQLVDDGRAERDSPDFRRAAGEASRAAEEAVLTARFLDDDAMTGSSLLVFAQVKTACLETDAAMKATEEALALFKESGDEQNIAAVLCVQADIHLANGSNNKAVQLADRALKIYQALDDERGAWVARSIKEHVSGPVAPAIQDQPERQEWTEAEIRQWEQWQGEHGQQPVPQQGRHDLHAQRPETAVAKPKRKVVDSGERLDLANLNPDSVARRLAEIVRVTVEMDEDEGLGLDVPLVEAGVTSRSAVLLRNAISDELPSMPLPFTMVFDYPSVNAITDLVLDSLETAAG